MKIIKQTLGSTGRTFLGYLAHVSRLVDLTKDALYWTIIAPWKGKGGVRWKSTMSQLTQWTVEADKVITF